MAPRWCHLVSLWMWSRSRCDDALGPGEMDLRYVILDMFMLIVFAVVIDDFLGLCKSGPSTDSH